MIFPKGVKPQGTIIKPADYKVKKQPTQQVTLDAPITNLATITSNNSSLKVPGEIKTFAKPALSKADEQVYYNADIFTSRQKYKQKVDYQSVQHLPIPIKDRSIPSKDRSIPVKDRSKSLNTQHPNSVSANKPLQSIQEEKMVNIHGEFDLQAYKQISTLLKNMKMAFNENQAEFLANTQRYIELVTGSALTQLGHIKMAQNKRQTIKQCFVVERQAVLAVCLTIVTSQAEKYKNYSNNLLKYIYHNYLVVLNLLTHQTHPYVLKLIEQEQQGYLHDKAFEFLRTTREVIADLINKVVKLDPLFAAEYYKIAENLAGKPVDFVFNALLTFFAFFVHALKAQHAMPFLACAASPYLVQKPSHEYTLVIDFMRVFLNDGRCWGKQRRSREGVSLRPYAQHFVREMGRYFEVVSYCNSMPSECNSIISAIDQTAVVRHRLYKYHFSHAHRDLTKIGRHTDKLILLDTQEDEHNQHLLLISNWKGEANNVQLAELCPLLALIAVKRLPTVQSLLKIREQVKSNSELGLKYINCGFDL